MERNCPRSVKSSILSEIPARRGIKTHRWETRPPWEIDAARRTCDYSDKVGGSIPNLTLGVPSDREVLGFFFFREPWGGEILRSSLEEHRERVLHGAYIYQFYDALRGKSGFNRSPRCPDKLLQRLYPPSILFTYVPTALSRPREVARPYTARVLSSSRVSARRCPRS